MSLKNCVIVLIKRIESEKPSCACLLCVTITVLFAIIVFKFIPVFFLNRGSFYSYVSLAISNIYFLNKMQNQENQAKPTRTIARKSSFPSRWYSSVGLIFDKEALEKSPARKPKTKKQKSKTKRVNEMKAPLNLKPIQIKPVDDLEFHIPMNVMKASVIKTKHDILKNWNVKKDGSFKYYEEQKEKEEN